MAELARAPESPTRRRREHFHGDFAWLWCGQSLAEVGAAISVVVLPLVAIDHVDASASSVGLLVAALWAPGLIIGLHAGVWVGRRSQRAVMLGAHLGRAALLTSVPVAALMDLLTYGHLLGVALGIGTLTVLFDIAYQSFLPSVLRRNLLIEGNSRMQVSAASARVAGPGVGGWLVQAFGAPLALFGEVAAFVVAAAALSRTRTRGRATLPAVRSRHAIREGLAFTLREPSLRTLTAVAASINLTLGAYEALVIVFLRRVVGMTPASIGLLFAVAGAAGVAAAAASGMLVRRLGSARVLIMAVLLITTLAPLTAFASASSSGMVVFAVGACGLLAGASWFNIIVRAFRQAFCPPEMLSRVTASMRFLLLGALPLGAILGGALAHWLEPRRALAAVLLANVVPATVLLTSPLRRMRDLPSDPVSLVVMTTDQ